MHLLSWVSAEALEGLYASAACLVCPSLHEGFGLPVLEAMVRWLPVACSGCGALAEVAGDAAVLFDPRAPESIAAGVERLLTDTAEAHRLAEAGARRAAQFSWTAAAVATLQSYERAAQ